MICNKKFVTALLIALIFQFTSFFNASQAVIQKGGLEYNSDRFDYSTLNAQKLIYEGNASFNQALSAKSKYGRDKAFEDAMLKYYLSSKANPANSYALTQIARIHAIKNEDNYAREYFFKAVNLDGKNPHTHYYFGEFYFKRNNLDKALKHYLLAYQNGYDDNYNLNCRLGIVYEKLADLENSKRFYERALRLNPQKNALRNKIENINNLNYDKSEYYYIIRE